jgi:hypothetical protein
VENLKVRFRSIARIKKKNTMKSVKRTIVREVFIITCDVELGKPHKLLESPGIDPVMANDGLWGRGFGKKRMTSCNERYRGSICPNPRGC